MLNTQNKRLLYYLHTHDGVTQLEALNELGIFRLASRISDLRRQGEDISSEMVTVNNRFGEKVRIKRYFIA
jgi:hypothetical protein